MSFFETGNPDYHAVAWDNSSPPVAVLAGEFGTILYSTGREYADGFQVYSVEKANPVTYNRIYGLAFGNGTFVAVCAGGIVLTSKNGQNWTASTSPVTENLRSVAHVTADTFIAVGDGAKIIKTQNGGTSWVEISSPGGGSLQGVAYGGGLLVAVGEQNAAYSQDLGATWTLSPTGVDPQLTGVTYGLDAFYICGEKSVLLVTTDGIDFTPLSSPLAAEFRAITWTGGLFVVVGEDGATATSVDGINWNSQDSGIPEGDFLGVGYGDNRLVAVGRDGLVAYSMTGAGRPAFDLFQPISDIYRASCLAQQDAYMLYANILAYEDGKWNHYPRRVMSPAPGTIDDFTTVGWYFTDLPGTGAVMDLESIRGGVVVAETDQLSIITDGGSLSSPWAYQQNYGEGLKPVSNLTSFNGVAYVIADDGLIYSASSVGVNRLQSFFDLSRFEDWNASAESVWLGFDPVYQLLFVFRQASPWTLWLVNDDTGGVSEIALPTVTVDGVDYEPRSAFIVEGLHNGIHTSYAPTSGGSGEILNVRLDLDGGITGIDDIAAGETDRWYSEIASGSFRVVSLGMRGSCDEIKVRTWADPDSTVRPDLAVMVREETLDDWLTNDQPAGEITVFPDRVLGVGTAFSRYVDRGLTEAEINMTVPEVTVTAFDMAVTHPKPIGMTVPSIEITPYDFIVQDAGQAGIKMSVPTVTATPIDVQVQHYPPIGMSVPSVNVTSVNMEVRRDGFYVLPWLVDQCRIYIESALGTRTLASYTKVGSHSILLDTPLNDFQSLYVNPGAVRPFVLGREGDYIFTQYGAHRITAVNTCYEVELNWYPPAECEGTYVPAREIPAGGPEGDGSVIVGLGRPMDQFMFRILLLPYPGCDAAGAKITGIELGWRPSEQEMKTDSGG